MFWGLRLDPGQCYEEELESSFHISQAVLCPKNCKEGDTLVMVTVHDNEFPICWLRYPRQVQCPLDLLFQKGTKTTFKVVGPNSIDLTGYYLDADEDEEEEELALRPPREKRKRVLLQEEDKSSSVKKKKVKLNSASPDLAVLAGDEELETDDDDETFQVDSSEEDQLETTAVEDGEEEEEDDEDDDEEEEEEEGDEEEEEDDDESEEEQELEVKPKKTPVKPSSGASPTLKSATPSSKKVNGTLVASAKKVVSFTPKGDSQTTPKNKPEAKEALSKTPKPGKAQVLEGGIGVKELRIGQGPTAKPGRMILVNYVGWLAKGRKEFDRSSKPFTFTLGRGEVIKGWDIGIKGMRVGGKRILNVPASKGYGKKGAPPDIPPNSDLIFEVELKGVA